MIDNEDARPLTAEEKEVLSRALRRSVTEVPDPRIAALESEVARLRRVVCDAISLLGDWGNVGKNNE